MKLGNEFIKNKFDDIDGKIDFVIERYRTLQQENKDLLLKVQDFEAELEKRDEIGIRLPGQAAFFQSKIDRLLSKLDNFSIKGPAGRSSNL
jgi:cell division septum initiation protein DivIVA